MSYYAIDVLQQDTAVVALVAINKRVDDAAAVLWLDSQNRTTSPALESLTILSSEPNYNSSAASSTLLSMETNTYTQIFPWHTLIANNSSPAVFDHVYKNQIMSVKSTKIINDHE